MTKKPTKRKPRNRVGAREDLTSLLKENLGAKIQMRVVIDLEVAAGIGPKGFDRDEFNEAVVSAARDLADSFEFNEVGITGLTTEELGRDG